MTALSSVVDSLVLLFGTGVVEHVSVVVLALLVKGVLPHQVVLIGQLQDHGKEAQQRQHDVFVERALKHLDFGQMRLDQVWVVIFAFKVGRKLGNFSNGQLIPICMQKYLCTRGYMSRQKETANFRTRPHCCTSPCC